MFEIIDSRYTNDLCVLTLKGKIDATNALYFDDEMQKNINESQDKVLLNMKELEYISSAGLRVLMSAAKSLKERGGDLCVCELSPHIDKIFEISGFRQIMSIGKSESEAIKNFK